MSAAAVIRQARELLAALVDPVVQSDADAVESLVELRLVGQLVAARTLRQLGEVEARSLPSSVGAAHVAPWAADVLKVSRATVRKMHRLDKALAAAPVIADAFAAGRLSGEQAQIMADVAVVLPAGSQRLILERGIPFGPDELLVVLRELREELDPDGTQQRDEDAAGRAEERARERRRVSLSRLDGSNLVRIEGYLDVVAGASFLTAIDALCAPRNRTALGVGFVEGEADLRTAGQRRHDAVCEIGNRVQATGALPDHGGDRPQAVVTVGLDTLVDEEAGGLGFLDDGTPLTPSVCRLMACDARVLPVVMGGESLPLDRGRTRRLFTGAVRRALNLRDRGCAFPGCDRGIPWTEAHHCRPWYRVAAATSASPCFPTWQAASPVTWPDDAPCESLHPYPRRRTPGLFDQFTPSRQHLEYSVSRGGASGSQATVMIAALP